MYLPWPTRPGGNLRQPWPPAANRCTLVLPSPAAATWAAPMPTSSLGGLLLEWKATLGPCRQSDGRRYCSLDLITLQQLLGYLLLDYHWVQSSWLVPHRTGT